MIPTKQLLPYCLIRASFVPGFLVDSALQHQTRFILSCITSRVDCNLFAAGTSAGEQTLEIDELSFVKSFLCVSFLSLLQFLGITQGEPT